MNSNTPSKKVRFITPRNILKEKIGGGGIDTALIQKAQTVINESQFDFIPLAKDLIQKFGAAVDSAKTINPDNTKKIGQALEDMTVIIMQLKANGGMFHYQLIGDVAEVSLVFLEDLETLNSDAFDVLTAHRATLNAIVGSGLAGDGGKEGDALIRELNAANARYNAKYPKKESAESAE